MTIFERDKWATPQSLVDAVGRIAFGGQAPTYDLCASKENTKARYFCSEGEENLFDYLDIFTGHPYVTIPPSAWAWMNPPYSRGNLHRFCKAAYEIAGNMPVAVLTPAMMSDGWYRDFLAPRAQQILVPTSRVQFIPPPGVKASGTAQNHIVTILRGGADGDPVVKFFDWRGEK